MLSALALIACVSPAPGAEVQPYVSERYGFRLERPEAWGFYGSRGQGDAIFTFSTSPRDTPGLPSFVVYVAEWDGAASAEAIRDLAVRKLEAAGVEGIETGVVGVAEREAPWAGGRSATAGGASYDVRYAYVVEAPYVYALQLAWPAADDAARATIETIQASFGLVPPVLDEPSAEEDRWRALARECGSEIAWAKSWDEAAERARSEHRLVLAVFENYALLELPETLPSGTFMDPDLVALVEERLVALRLGAHDPAPFRDPGAFGVSEHAWGTGFLFVTPDGEVVRETGVSDASYLAEFARAVLAEHAPEAPESRSGAGEDASGADADAPAGEKAPGSEGEDPIAAASRCLRRGELEQAERLLQRSRSAEAHRLRAAIFRQRRQGDRALAALRDARRASGPELEPELRVEEALIRMRMGEPLEAEPIFERVVSEHPDSAAAPEALFWLGAFEVLRNGLDEPSPRWKSLVETHPESRWAWKAAANLLREGAFVHGGERLAWPEPELVRAATKPARAPLPETAIDRIEDEAVAFLVGAQADDGSWQNLSDAFGQGYDLYTPAITAICGTSLIPFRERAGAAKAVRRALANALDCHASGRLAPGNDLVAVYAIWGRAFVLAFFADAVRARLGDADELREAMDALALAIEAGQHAHGGWPYITLPGDPNAEGFDPSASFLTAGVVIALLEARAAGAEIPEESLQKGLAFLDRMRLDDGSYRYMPGLVEGEGPHPEAAGRGPVCALALRRGGVAGVERVREVLDLFLQHRSTLAKEWHKELCHTGPQGQGSHYLFYDYRFAAAALRELPAEDRGRYRTVVLGDVLEHRLADGSFEDMPLLGRPYATAMALLALAELRGK